MLAAMLGAMAAMFVAALAVPNAFGSHALLFGVAFLIVNLMHLALFTLAARDDPDFLSAVTRLVWTALPGAVLIFVAAFVSSDLRPLLWLAALAIGMLGPLFEGLEGWRLEPRISSSAMP